MEYHSHAVVTERNVVLLELGQASDLTDYVANEVRVALVYNGISHTVMLASPENLEEFAIGFTLSERIVSHVNEIKGVDLEFTPEGVLIQVEITQRCFMELKQQRRNMAGRTGCGLCGVAQLEEAVKPVIRVDSDARFNIDHLQFALEQVKENQHHFRLTGATHAAMGLDQDGQIIAAFEDIGRHIALDKLIGGFSMRQAQRPVAVLLTSRASFEMVQKAASANIQILFAMSAVTSLALELAEKSNITLIGFCRNGRATLYTHGYRLLGQQCVSLAKAI
ncbi:MAG: formate dehydrogenase accessory sulfurtransferase FdhD [Gammaproteobacteria bacterium]|uniref:formate dehydrogenase accessory sulfurtransferase FdhD n=1 Tax=Shewanella sp. SP1S2-4 TaxID=3063537 RepID=UPI001DD4E934|nr:formate dehydrogenase accessory sulfurtransferase FdhD [Shewanella sp. SP1S2-4]MBU1392287.1 formate dehydrogenase accessory sulfurtransferase FdhD [Gammaproteobacteria bacterium]MBU1476931.1 formate dehydrogenase accessory sulfurtransferase FdhD [Gammaproteobacteria bacterium]MBU2003499.1 formate dehydrogenase accessory sulfurtransferase FdhD [Gammaproteobacteria bacterium]MBU2134527.1 formate dehydrogenase accessory sulfurtransferase FdhD [Gammaproteobacteria bacterium]MBU2188043.1 formate